MGGNGTLRWLHLSDLHRGCKGEEVWWQTLSEFRDSIRENYPRCGPIDLILVTGDLAFKGAPDEYAAFDRFLDELRGWLREAGQAVDPLVIPVPGNHDLVRPEGRNRSNLSVLKSFWSNPDDEDLLAFKDAIWKEKDVSAFDPLFKNYSHWLNESVLPVLRRRLGEDAVHCSHFPGDLSVRLDLPGRPPATVVGLNSAWMQYTGEDFERKIELFTQQLHCALGAEPGRSPLERLDRRLNLLLMHHPPAWLSRASRKRFEEEIYLPDRFLLCLHGHMHKARSQAVAVSGDDIRYQFQSPSLFGLEDYGTAKESRAMGYVWGALDAAGTVRMWPLRRASQGSRQGFIWDWEFKFDPKDGRQIRPLLQSEVIPQAVELRPWLRALLERVGHIEISGIGAGVGRTRDASRYPIDQLYTALRSRDEGMRAAEREGAGSGLAHGAEPVMLADLLARHSRLLIEGQPGAGKTTFLKLVATMLARDIVGVPAPDGATWRGTQLGLEATAPPLVPLFLKLSELALTLAKPECLPDGDDRCRLLALLDGTAGAAPGPAWRTHWEGILERGEAILLLDGLDEVADDALRLRVFAIFRDAGHHWDKCPIVVTSRPIAVEAVKQMGFHHAVIEPFGEREINAFIERWMAALHNLQIGQRPEGEAGVKVDRILAAVLERPAIRRVAANPVMLTCLCVVHWNEGDLPEGRARLYRAVIHWLIAARSRQRIQAGFTDRFAHEAFAALALAMMGNAKGSKIAIVELEHAAAIVEPLVKRHFPQERALPGARAWLRFECLWSGVVEERAGGKIGFWHLTFQEYLAAQELAWRGDGDIAEGWWQVVRERLDELQWRETVDLLPGTLFDEGGAQRVDLLLQRVIELRPALKQPARAGGDVGSLRWLKNAVTRLWQTPSSLAVDAWAFGLLGRLLTPLTAYDFKPNPEIEARRLALRDRILPMFSREGAATVPAAVRIAAAEALGRGGDPRLNVDNFIEVPGSGGVRLGKYLVTVQEFQAFVDAGGYDEPRYWSDEGWRHRTERSWTSPDGWDVQTEYPNRPVTGVSWYEAEAWCRWRSAETGRIVRLPTETEWEAAAAPDGREYPWGAEEPDPERANFGGNVRSATPVGVYPAGDGPHGHCDLAGNVWEWSADAYSKQDDDKVLRGGAWDYPPEFLRAAYRGGYHAEGRFITVGFRVAAAPASTAPEDASRQDS